MNRIHILVAVDVEAALAGGTLQGCVYVVDSNSYLGSWQDGQSQLHTVCQDGQRLSWSAAPVDPGTGVAVAWFRGPAVDGRVCVPSPDTIAGDGVWSGQVQSRGEFASFGYTVGVALGAQQLTFDAYLKVV